MRAAERLAEVGVAVSDIDLPDAFSGLRNAQLAVMMGEARPALLNEYRSHPTLLDPRYIDAIEGERHVPPTKLRVALDLGARCRISFDALAEPIDAILTPSATDKAPIFGNGTGNAAFNQIGACCMCRASTCRCWRDRMACPLG